MGEYGIPGLIGISNWLDELLSRLNTAYVIFSSVASWVYKFCVLV